MANLVADLGLTGASITQLRLLTCSDIAWPPGPAHSAEPSNGDDHRDPRLSPELSVRKVPPGSNRAYVTRTQLGFYKPAAFGFLANPTPTDTVSSALSDAVRRTASVKRDPAWEQRAAANLALYLAVCSETLARHAEAAHEPDLASKASWTAGVLRCELVVLTTAVLAQAANGGVDTGRVLARITWNQQALNWMEHISALDTLATPLLAALEAFPPIPPTPPDSAVGAQLEQARRQVHTWSLSAQHTPKGLHLP